MINKVVLRGGDAHPNYVQLTDGQPTAGNVVLLEGIATATSSEFGHLNPGRPDVRGSGSPVRRAKSSVTVTLADTLLVSIEMVAEQMISIDLSSELA